MARPLAAPGAVLLALGALSACNGRSGETGNGAGEGTHVTAVKSGAPIAAPQQIMGTPMTERVAVIGILNKRNGLTNDLSMKPGQALRVGAAIVRLRACETTAPWESPPETGAFVQVDVLETADKKWHRRFSGWLFKNRPDRNVVQHPIYDVWVKSCTMSWPETGADTVRLSDGKAGAARSSSASNEAEDMSGNPGTAPSTAIANSSE